MIDVVSGAFVASLAGSLHCVGMCGGIVAAYAGNRGGGRGAREHAAYHLTRLGAYAGLGLAAGAVGGAVDVAGVAMGLGPIAVAVAGATMVFAGLVALIRLAGVNLPAGRTPLWLGRALSRMSRAASGRGPVVQAGILGMSTALLPCGWLWAFVVAAAGTGSPLWGAATMAGFWAGTVPALTGLGVGLKALAGRMGRKVAAVGAIAVMAVGLWTIGARAQMPGPRLETVTLSADIIPAGEPSCCHGAD